MIDFIKKLIDENTSYSSQRFALLFILFMNLVLAIVVCVLCFQVANIIYINSLIDLITFTLGIAITGKFVSKFAENKTEDKK